MRSYFPDTNFFLECRKASDLPWHELTGVSPRDAEDVRLIVPPTVISEIDRHKTKGNRRTARRARDTSAVLRKALTTPGHMTEIRPSGPRVILELPAVVKPDFLALVDLDQTRPDHRIVAEYAEVLKVAPGLLILTDDTLLVLAARSLGFEPILIPEAWKLAPEKDERDDEIERLRTELRDLKQTSPEVIVTLLDSSGNEVGAIEADISVYAVSTDEIEAATASFEASFPIETNFDRSRPGSTSVLGYPSVLANMWQPPPADEISSYQTELYPNWIRTIRESLPVLASQLNQVSRQISFSVRIENLGFVNASSVRLTITGYDGVLLLGALTEKEIAERDEKLSLPPPPRPPRWRQPWDTFSGMRLAEIAALPPLNVPRLTPRDKNKFYYTGELTKTVVEQLELTCEAFPHQGDPYILAFRAVIPERGVGRQARVRVRLQATNLRRPIEKYVPVSAKLRRGELMEHVNEIREKLLFAHTHGISPT